MKTVDVMVITTHLATSMILMGHAKMIVIDVDTITVMMKTVADLVNTIAGKTAGIEIIVHVAIRLDMTMKMKNQETKITVMIVKTKVETVARSIKIMLGKTIHQ